MIAENASMVRPNASLELRLNINDKGAEDLFGYVEDESSRSSYIIEVRIHRGHDSQRPGFTEARICRGQDSQRPGFAEARIRRGEDSQRPGFTEVRIRRGQAE